MAGQRIAWKLETHPCHCIVEVIYAELGHYYSDPSLRATKPNISNNEICMKTMGRVWAGVGSRGETSPGVARLADSTEHTLPWESH